MPTDNHLEFDLEVKIKILEERVTRLEKYIKGRRRSRYIWILSVIIYLVFMIIYFYRVLNIAI